MAFAKISSKTDHVDALESRPCDRISNYADKNVVMKKIRRVNLSYSFRISCWKTWVSIAIFLLITLTAQSVLAEEDEHNYNCFDGFINPSTGSK